MIRLKTFTWPMNLDRRVPQGTMVVGRRKTGKQVEKIAQMIINHINIDK
jgi:hypothetical protein